MSLEELEFYKCKSCSAKLIAGKYCIDCAKEQKMITLEKAIFKDTINKSKNPGYPFIGAGDTLTYDTEVDLGDITTGTSAGTLPIAWDNFTTAGNAITATGANVTVGSCTAMDFSASTASQIGQDHLQGRRKKSRR